MLDKIRYTKSKPTMHFRVPDTLRTCSHLRVIDGHMSSSRFEAQLHSRFDCKEESRHRVINRWRRCASFICMKRGIELINWA
jgi:hypothetical protein